jgi:hypothetical protein
MKCLFLMLEIIRITKRSKLTNYEEIFKLFIDNKNCEL